MKVLKCYIFLFFVCCSAFAQSNFSLDSLSKYSYFVFAQIDSNKIEQGTCFFIKHNGKLYLTTAAHVINGWDYVNNKIKIDNFPDFLSLRIYRENITHPEFIKINIKSLKNKIRQGDFLKTPDICFLKVNIPSSYKIYTLDKLILNSHPNQNKPDSVVVCGYPVNDSVNDFYTYVSLPARLGSGILGMKSYSDSLIWDSIENTDLSNYYIKNIKNIGRGDSGSPAYFFINGVISFGGLVFSADFSSKNAYIIRPEYLIKLLNAKKSIGSVSLIN